MKNFMCLCLSLLLIFALCGCETEEEKEAKEAAKDAERLKEQYYNALEEYNDLKNDINTYYNNQNKLGYWNNWILYLLTFKGVSKWKKRFALYLFRHYSV